MFDFLKKNTDDETVEKEFRFQRPKIGLALGSGVARGWAHIGILKALRDAGIEPDVISGTSIGAVVGGAYISGGFDALEKWALELAEVNFFRFLNFKVFGGGLFGGSKLGDLMKKNFGDGNIEDMAKPFTAISTELMTGHEIWLQQGNLIEALKASFALPGVFEPINHDGRWLVDGALVNPVPVSACRAMGAELVIAVNLTEDVYGRARADRQGLMSTGKYGVYSESTGSGKIIDSDAPKAVLKQMMKHEKGAPSLFANMVASLNIVQNRLSRSRLAGDPPDIMISPKCGHIGLMEFHRAEELIKLGQQSFEEVKPEIVDALQLIGYRRALSRA